MSNELLRILVDVERVKRRARIAIACMRTYAVRLAELDTEAVSFTADELECVATAGSELVAMLDKEEMDNENPEFVIVKLERSMVDAYLVGDDNGELEKELGHAMMEYRF